MIIQAIYFAVLHTFSSIDECIRLYLAKTVTVLTASSTWHGYLSHKAAHHSPDDSLSLKIFLSKLLMPFYMVIVWALISFLKLSHTGIVFVRITVTQNAPHLNRYLISREQNSLWKHKVREKKEKQRNKTTHMSICWFFLMFADSQQLPLHKAM